MDIREGEGRKRREGRKREREKRVKEGWRERRESKKGGKKRGRME